MCCVILYYLLRCYSLFKLNKALDRGKENLHRYRCYIFGIKESPKTWAAGTWHPSRGWAPGGSPGTGLGMLQPQSPPWHQLPPEICPHPKSWVWHSSECWGCRQGLGWPQNPTLCAQSKVQSYPELLQLFSRLYSNQGYPLWRKSACFLKLVVGLWQKKKKKKMLREKGPDRHMKNISSCVIL